MDTNKLGSYGEKQAARFLRRKGYSIVEMNYRCRVGEIDIIAQNEEFIVFAEVKLRKYALYGEAREFVGYSKQQKLIRTAMLWLSSHECFLQPRFDVLEVYAPKGVLGGFEINHIENAFM